VAVFAVLAGTAVLLIAFLVARHVTGPNTSPATPRRQMISSPPRVVLPSIAQVRQARVLARQRFGDVSFAVVDTSGKLHCYRCNERYVAASVVKAMLLIGYLEQLAEDDRPLSSSHRAFLSVMIRRSDNASADAIYLHVGDPGLYRIAAEAGMARFDVHGDWTKARITAADQARLFARIDTLTPAKFRSYTRGLLASVVPSQAWGIPEVSRPRWMTLFKGGWRHTSRGHLVHQVARLERRGLAIAIAVLTDGNPNDGYGRTTIRGIAARLLRP
jgi:Beta-lactamase enzyme family